MADDPVQAAFDAVVEQLDTAMLVVTVAADGERDGCLVGFHSQASIHPRRYVVWLSVANRTFRLATTATHLAVHALGAGDHHLAERFGGATADDPAVDKLDGLDWTAGPGGAPVLTDLRAHVVGRILGRVETPEGDHVGFVLDPVLASSPGAGSPAGPPLRLSDASDIDPGHDA